MPAAKPYALRSALLLFLTTFAVLTAGPLPARESCATLVDSRCQSCHHKARICQALGTKSARGWKKTVRRMVGYGAHLSAGEQQLVIDCLSRAAPGQAPLCSQPKKP